MRRLDNHPSPISVIQPNPVPQMGPDAEALLEQARENERKFARIRHSEFRLMTAQTLAESLSIITTSLPKRHGWDAVHLTLVDSDYSLRRILSGPHGKTEIDSSISFVDSDTGLDVVVQHSRLPRMEPYRARNHAKIFGRARLESVCLLPLCRGKTLVGSLYLGSTNPDRFEATAETDFLQHLAAVMAISIEAVSARDQLTLVSLTDPLTGVSNRRFFDRRVSDEILRARREGIPVSMLFIDVDHFKSANDIGGHAYGDELLRSIAAAIGNEVRVSDVLCRYGGDEFACLLGGTNTRGAAEIGERIRDAVEYLGKSVVKPGMQPVTVSIGVASVSDGSFTAEELVRRADEAVYIAKDAGRNHVATYRQAIEAQSALSF